MPDLNQAQFDVRYHITDNPRFSLDPRHRPDDNSLSMRNMQQMPKGLFVTKHPEAWVNGHEYVRPFVAEVHVPHGTLQPGHFGGEEFIPAEHFDQAQVKRVIPLDAHAREEYGSHGWIEDHHGTEFDTGKPIPRWGQPGFKPSGAMPPGYRYSGPDARDMGDREIKQHMKRWSGFMQGARGWPKEEAEALPPKRWGPPRPTVMP
jgi:hypothetical protein